MTIDNILDNIYTLPQSDKEVLKNYILEVNYPKGHLLMQANKVENNIYFIKKGIVRAYKETIDHEVTFWFGTEGDPVVSMKSYIRGQRGYETIELLEKSTFYKLRTHRLQELFQTHIHLANWGRKFAEYSLIKAEERLITLQFKTALERYQSLLKNQPNLLQRVPLKHIASYLGITQVSLSRIRGQIE
ncbi:MAG: Crp/Fnr family transcriptional regulator [Bacteroides sp.]|mgnify:FL=1|nr:Crp/Fnr family transcriptional regulator [Bacteroides sp.]MDD2646136.1 Crp/Fnr family transcriptional regulator [Bacteroides sp.]